MSNGKVIDPSVIKVLNNVNASNPDFYYEQGEIEEVSLTKLTPIKGKQLDVILPNINPTDIPNIKDFKPAENLIQMGNYSQTYTTAEDRIHLYKFADPLTLNFKVLIDFNKPSGLFADFDESDPNSEKTNSALGYLWRIGETERYYMLKQWINNFTALVKDFDFLFLDIEGLDVVQTKPNHEFFLDKEKIKITFRETTDMLIQSMITSYNTIVYDKIRKVTVLPSNLRKFDCYVIVFSAGYYNMLFHDIDNQNPDNLDNKVLPTKRKLSDEMLTLDTIDEFTHTLYEFISCNIDPESGSMFTDTISNEMTGDYVKNNLTFTYKFANVSGTYNNITGNENWFSILARASAENKLQNTQRLQVINSLQNNVSADSSKDGKNIFSKDNLNKILDNTVINKKLLNNLKEFKNLDNYKNIYKKVKGKTLSHLEDKLVNDLPTKLLGPNSIIGKNLQKLNMNELNNLVQNTADLGISKLQDLYETGITKVNNLLSSNYNDNLVDVYDNIFGGKIKNQIEIIEQPKKDKYNYNNSDDYTEQGYIRPDNPRYDESLDDDKFIKSTNGISFFGAANEEKFRQVTNNITIRKGF